MSAVAPPRQIEGAVAFTDIVGFTEYTATEGDEEALALLSLQERIVLAALPEGARIVKELGDGLLLWFPECDSALVTLLRLQDDFEAESERSLLPLWVRIGLHWGRQTTRRDDLVGHDVNVASRIVNLAGPGEVLLSDVTVARVGGDRDFSRFEEIGPVMMKGIPEPIRLFRAVRAPWAS
jgi:adenylate cyclase